MNRPRLFTHWIPKLQSLNEKSLLQFRQQSTHSRLKFIDEYLKDARRGEDKVHSFTPWMPESTYNRDKAVVPELSENITATPRSRLHRLITSIHIVPLPQICDSPTSLLSSVSSTFSETMAEVSCNSESHSPASQDDAGAGLGDLLSVSTAES